MMSPAAVVRQLLPEIDDRIWMMVMAIGGFAALAMKDVTLPAPLILVGMIASLGALLMIGGFSPEFLLYALVAYLPFSRLLGGDPTSHPHRVTPTMLLMVLTAGLYGWKRIAERKPIADSTPLGRMIALFAVCGIGSLMCAGWVYGGWYVPTHVRSLITWLTPMGCYFLTLWIVRDARTLKTILALIMVAVTIVALMALWEYLDRADDSFDRSRVGGIADQPNLLGAFFIYYMFLFLAFFLTAPSRPRMWLFAGLFLLCVRGMMVTFSRGAYLAFGVGILALCLFKNRWLFLAAIALGAVALANPSLLPAGIRYRMNMTLTKAGGEFSIPGDVTQHLETSAGARVEIWRGAVRMIQDHPWRGVGFGAFTAFLPHYTQGRLNDLDAHNSFLMVAAEMGILSLLVLLLILGTVFVQAYWLKRHSRDPTIQAMALGVLAGLSGLLVANLFTVCLTAPEVVGYFWILCALVTRAVLLERNVVVRSV